MTSSRLAALGQQVRRAVVTELKSEFHCSVYFSDVCVSVSVLDLPCLVDDDVATAAAMLTFTLTFNFFSSFNILLDFNELLRRLTKHFQRYSAPAATFTHSPIYGISYGAYIFVFVAAGSQCGTGYSSVQLSGQGQV